MTDWNKSKILDLLAKNDKAIGRALLRLTERQTFDEQEAKDTKYKNGRGFRPCHSRVGVLGGLYFRKHGQLEDWQLAYWRKADKNGVMRIGIYASQLLTIMKEDQVK